jgi:lysophospholipase L1-like esterase
MAWRAKGNQGAGWHGGWGRKPEYCTKREIMDSVHAGMYKGAEDCRAKHRWYAWPALQVEEAIIVADSILKQVRHLRRTYVHAIPGARIERIDEDIKGGIIDVSFQRAVVVCAGTNNLSRDTPHEICDKMAALVDTIRSRNSDCLIMVSGIIIRPVDEDEERTWKRKGDPSLVEKRRQANDMMEPMLKARGVTMLETWSALMINSTANRAMYGDDGLHLNYKGLNRIQQFLLNCLGGALPKSQPKPT